MFHHLLVPVDLSRRSSHIVDVARDLAFATGARVTVLHAIQQIAHVPQRELRRFYTDLERRAHDRVDRAVRRIRRARLDVAGIVAYGADIHTVVLEHVDSLGIDLIVMGSHQLGRTPATGIGTTSYKVAILAPCPILLVK